MVLNWTIRKAKKEDLDQICIMEKQFGIDAFDREDFITYLNSDMFCIAEVDGVILGYYICLINYGILSGRVYSICVDKTFHGRGLGRIMMENLEKKCIEKGLESIRLEVSEKNNAFFLYEKLGYINSGIKENYYTDGANAIFMKKNLLTA
jgi:ribosomal-protein-alanine N-acetyltransferase